MPTMQIDLKPVNKSAGATSYFMDLMIDGITIRSILTNEQADKMVRYNLVRQVNYQIEVNGQLETRQYPDKVDGSGVQFISKEYEIKEKKSTS